MTLEQDIIINKNQKKMESFGKPKQPPEANKNPNQIQPQICIPHFPDVISIAAIKS